MPKHKTNIFERHPLKTLLTIILFGFLTLDFGGAALLNALGLFEPSYVTSKKLERYYRRPDPIFHHALAPNIDYDKAEWGGKLHAIKTNSLGFKDRAVREIALNTDKQRILFMGDSFNGVVG